MRVYSRRFLHICLCSFAIVLFCLSAFFVFFPVNFASATQGYTLPDDYNAFYQSFLDMQGSNQDDEIASISTFSDVENEENNRLIVYSENYVPNCGAKWEARYKEWNIFQYETYQQTENAYNQLVNLNYDVSFDERVTVSENDVEAYNTTTHTYNTWADKYMNYDSFIKTHLTGNLDDVYVFVFDTGINKYHELFQGRIDESLAQSFMSYTPTAIQNTPNPADYSYYDDHYLVSNGVLVNGHGTHTSGTIAELTKDNVKIVPYKVLNSKGEGSVSGIIVAVEQLIRIKKSNPNMKIVANMSLGVDYSDSIENASNSKLTVAVRNGANAGIAFVVSAGNESQDTANVSPASCNEAIVVSALKEGGYLNNGVVFDSSYSNFGSHVDFAAPGTIISSASNLANSGNKGYHTLSGTSMAAPHIAACYALMFSLPRYTTLEGVTQTLIDNCIDLGRTNRDDYYGYGYVDMSTIDQIISLSTVQFSGQTDEEKGAQSATFNLSFSETGADNVKIYYTFDEHETRLNESTWTLYSGPVTISNTQKVSSVAKYTNNDGIIAESTFASKVYYVENYDLLSNYEFSVYEGWYSNEAYIKKYYGSELKTLNVPTGFYYTTSSNSQTVKTAQVTTILGFAFGSGCNVQVLNLPNSIHAIEENAFNGDINIQEINAPGAYEVGKYAFRNCSSLKKISLSTSLAEIEMYTFYGCENLLLLGSSFANITNIGDYAFAGCTNLTLIETDFANVTDIGTYAFQDCVNLNVLTLPKIERIGDYAFLNATIQELLVGPKITQFIIKYETQILKMFGYCLSQPEILNNDTEYVDLTLRAITPMQEYTKYLKKGQQFEFDIEVVGYKLETPIKVSGSFTQIGDKTNNFTYKYHFIFEGDQSLSSKICFKDAFSYYIDAFGTGIDSPGQAKSLDINVVDPNTSTHNLICVGDHYTIKVDGAVVSEKTITLYVPYEYTIEVVPDEGYQIDTIVISTSPSKQQPIDQAVKVPKNVSDDVTLTVGTSLVTEFRLKFNYFGAVNDEEAGKAYVGDQKIEHYYSVSRDDIVQFTVKENVGYKLKSVTVDGDVLTDDNGVYTISGIIKNLTIDILFEQISYNVQVQSGVGGMYSNNAKEIKRGESITYVVSTSEGYVVDFVTVNGSVIKLNGNTFTIENVTEDMLIVISFKKQSGGFLSGDSVLLDYFIIFIVLFVVYGIMKLAIYLIRKNKPNLKK